MFTTGFLLLCCEIFRAARQRMLMLNPIFSNSQIVFLPGSLRQGDLPALTGNQGMLQSTNG
jgi:hypothetical protein